MGFKNDNQRKAVMATLNNGASVRQTSKSVSSVMNSKEKLLHSFNKGTWTESDVRRATQSLNRGAISTTELSNQNPLLKTEDGVSLTSEQEQKGLNFLRKLYYTPKGKVKENSPIKFREINMIENAKSVNLIGFYKDPRTDNYSPLYEIVSKDNDSMQYYYNNGQLSIVG